MGNIEGIMGYANVVGHFLRSSFKDAMKYGIPKARKVSQRYNQLLCLQSIHNVLKIYNLRMSRTLREKDKLAVPP